MTWLVEKASAGLVSNNPAVDEVVIFSGKKWVKELGKPGAWLRNFSEARQFFAELRAAKYDAVLELQGLLKSSLLARASGAKVVAGFDDTREFADHFLTHKLNVGDYFGHDVPVVELNLRVAHHALAVLGLPVPELPVEFPLPLLDSSVDVKVDALLISARSAAPGGAEPAGSNPETDAVLGAVPQNSVPAQGAVPKQGSVPEVGAAPEAGSVPQIGAIPDTGTLPVGTSKAEPDPTQSSSDQAKSCSDFSPGGPINIVLIPGTTWVTKIWPNYKWIELGERLADQYPCRLLLVGGPAEVNSNYAIASGIESARPAQVVLNLTGQTSLLDLISVFKRAALVIGADTGPLHLAAATGHPRVVGVFGSTPAKRNGPYGKQCQSVHLSLDCQPCYAKVCKYGTVACLTELDAARVLEATLY